MAVKRLKIGCFNSLSDAMKNTGISGSITVAANPEKVDFTLGTETKKNVDTGNYTGSVDFTLLLDSTGVLYDSEKTLSEQVDFLKKVAIAYHKSSKSSSYIRLEWGTVFSGIGAGESASVVDNYFIGKVTKLSIHYTLFSPNGDPLRSTVDLTVEQLIDLGESGKYSQNLDFSKEVSETALNDFKKAFRDKLIKAYDDIQKQNEDYKNSNKEVKVGLR